MKNEPFLTAGKRAGDVPVAISYRIIELFSAGLYSSPNKAIEELVANSYDALAQRVDLLLPLDLNADDAAIWVVDDGISMDAQGIEDLWQIASSRKRDSESSQRPPIGRFGIGKLATYVLARELTYVCLKDGVYRAITMDYDAIPKDSVAANPINLELRVLTRDEARGGLEPMSRNPGGPALLERLFASNSPSSWTAVAMSSLRPIAGQIRLGRLRWILSTALPMSPGFALTLNGEDVKSSLERETPLQTWVIGVDDKSAEKLGLRSDEDSSGPYVEVEGLGKIRGEASIYEDELTKGKAGELGRSHGFFVKVRKRLINLDDHLFGLPALSHGPYARFRMEVDADGLDGYLRSTRESVLEVPPVQDFRLYLNAKFNEARAYYSDFLEDEEKSARLSTRISRTPGSLSRRPLFNATVAALRGEISAPLLIKIPVDLDREQAEDLIGQLSDDLDAEEGLIKQVEAAALGVDRYIAIYDPVARKVLVNILHPFFANFAGHYHSPEPFELIAVAEVLTEAYLFDEQVAEDQIRALIDRRDRFLRELVYSGRQLGAPLVAQALLDSMSNRYDLEDAVFLGFKSLGFEVSKIGGNGEPDGIALARLGVRSTKATEPDDYKVTYDAKSSGQDKIKADKVGAATLARHRKKYAAQFTVVVAPDFYGANDANSALCVDCRDNGITPIGVRDMALLVQVAATRQLGFSKLRDLFVSCHTPVEVHDWIVKALETETTRAPIIELLETIDQLARVSPDPVTFGAIQVQLREQRAINVRVTQIREWVHSIWSLAPGYISMGEDGVALETSVSKVLDVVRQHGGMMPDNVIKDSFLAPLLKPPS